MFIEFLHANYDIKAVLSNIRLCEEEKAEGNDGAAENIKSLLKIGKQAWFIGKSDATRKYISSAASNGAYNNTDRLLGNYCHVFPTKSRIKSYDPG